MTFVNCVMDNLMDRGYDDMGHFTQAFIWGKSFSHFINCLWMTKTVNCLTIFVLHPDDIYAFSREPHLNLIQRNQKLTFQ